MERIRINLPANFNFYTNIPIRITDLNYAGHVGNNVFLALVHEARQQYLLHLGYAELQFEGCGLTMTDAAIEFKKELNYGDVVKISVAAGGFDRFGFDIFYKLEIVNDGGVVIAGKAKTAIHCYDYAAKKIVPVPERAKEKLAL